jgi:hypothetical protein
LTDDSPHDLLRKKVKASSVRRFDRPRKETNSGAAVATCSHSSAATQAKNGKAKARVNGPRALLKDSLPQVASTCTRRPRPDPATVTRISVDVCHVAASRNRTSEHELVYR